MIKDYQIFRDTVVDVINNSNLDIGAVKFVLRDVMHTVEESYTHSINEEIKKEQEQAKTEEVAPQENVFPQDTATDVWDHVAPVPVNENPSPMSDEDEAVDGEIVE